MNWLFNAMNLTSPQLTEPLVDCNNCQLKSPLKRVGNYTVETKCCEFSPYWSSFAVGAWLESGNSLASIKPLVQGEMILTTIGIMHTLDHRLQEESLCLHFDKKNNNCSIWAQRPPTCFTFYCASEHNKGIKQYGLLEDWLLSIEAAAIKIYFAKNGIGDEVWQKWTEYMEAEPDPESFPSELLLTSFSEAEKIFKECFRWLQESKDCAHLRREVKNSWEHQFSWNPIYRRH